MQGDVLDGNVLCSLLLLLLLFEKVFLIYYVELNFLPYQYST